MAERNGKLKSGVDDVVEQLIQLTDLELDEVKRRFWGPSPGYRDYDIFSFPMDAAVTDKEWPVEGYFLFSWTDGSLNGIQVRPNSKAHGAIPLEKMGFESSVGFDRIWLTWTAQAGKTLYIFVGRRKGSRLTQLNLGGGAGGSGGVANSSTWSHGHKTVTASGTAEVMPTLGIPDGQKVTIRPLNSNTGLIYLGDTKADAEDTAKRCELDVGESISLMVTNLSLIWIDAAVSGEGVWYAVET